MTENSLSFKELSWSSSSACFCILAVFFIRDIGYMTFSISFSMVSYFILVVVLKRYRYHLEEINFLGYQVNQVHEELG